MYGVVVSEQCVVEFPCSPYFRWYFMKTYNFPVLVFLNNTSSSFCISCPCLTSYWILIIFVISLSVTFVAFFLPGRFLKNFFHRCIRSFWLAALTVALEVLFLLVISFTLYLAIRDCLSSTEILVLFLKSSIHSVCFCWLYAFLGFWALALVGFLLLHGDAILTLSTFFLNC